MVYLYRHIRLDKNEPFYIGIGKTLKNYSCFSEEYKRAYEKYNRSNFWKRITNKTRYKVEILYECDDKDCLK